MLFLIIFECKALVSVVETRQITLAMLIQLAMLVHVC